MIVFFFSSRRRHTRYWRDWSSDVCSSDLVQRRVLVAGRRLHRRDDLARDAQLREVAEARLAVAAVVADRLVEPDQALLDEVVRVAADQEVRRRLQADEAVVAADDAVVGVALAGLREGDEIVIINLELRLIVPDRRGGYGHSISLPAPTGAEKTGRDVPPLVVARFL